MKYVVVENEKYGYKRIDPIPSIEQVEQYYKEEFYSSKYKQFNDSQLSAQKEDEEFYCTHWETLYNNIINHFGKEKNISLFDIGCGFAQALLFFKNKGFNVSGLEPCIEGVEYAASQNLKVFHGGIEDIENTVEEKYDVVTMFNVLEHLREPERVIEFIRENMLNENGLIIIEVPNEFNDFQTIANEEYKLNEWWVVPPNHINYFTASSLEAMVKDKSFEIVNKQASFPLEIFMLFGDVYVGNQDLGREIHLKRVQFEKLMNKYNKTEKMNSFYEKLADMDLGRQITLIAKVK